MMNKGSPAREDIGRGGPGKREIMRKYKSQVDRLVLGIKSSVPAKYDKGNYFGKEKKLYSLFET